MSVPKRINFGKAFPCKKNHVANGLGAVPERRQTPVPVTIARPIIRPDL